jgi:hypothetical protein
MPFHAMGAKRNTGSVPKNKKASHDRHHGKPGCVIHNVINRCAWRGWDFL